MLRQAAASGTRAFILACALVCTLPASANAEPDPQTTSAAIAEFQVRDQLLQDIGWRLVTGNARLCTARPAIGLQLQDMASYGDPAAVRQALGLVGDFAVQTAASGSPAELAGLKPNDEVLAIDGHMLARDAAEARLDWRRLAQAHGRIDAALAASGAVTLTMQDGSRPALTGVAACPSRFELADTGKRALADGSRVQIGIDFPGFAYPRDEFAAALAHELAHNLLGHRTWLDTHGRKRSNVRLTEREADRLMPWLLASAGYDPHAALRFMQRWGPQHSGGIFRKRTHEGWDERAELIAAEITAMGALLEQGGVADWRQHFRREVAVQ